MKNCNCNKNYMSNMSSNQQMNNNYNQNYSPINSSITTANNPFPENYMYGHAYTPNQVMRETFSPEEGLIHGSIFQELVSPYCPGDSIALIEYLKASSKKGGCGCE